MTNYKQELFDAVKTAHKFLPIGESTIECGLRLKKLTDLIAKLPEEKEIYFLQADVGLTDAQYARLKANIDEVWPVTKPRPVLLEGVRVVKL
jgi:hypothetical protein